MIPLCTPDLTGNEKNYLSECISTGWVSSVGPFVSRFETNLATAVGAVGAVSVSSGTCGLHLALTTVGVQPGDLVLTPSFTFIASANAVSHCGATPWLIDIEPNGWSMDAELVQRCLREECHFDGSDLRHRKTGKRVSAMLPVHAVGSPADIDALMDVAAEFGLPVVFDAAAAIGSDYKGRPIAANAALSVFSFNGNKTVTTGGGGAICGTDTALLAKARHLASTARTGDEYDHDAVGFNYRLSNLSAAVGQAQLERLDHFIARKRQIARAYAEAFSPGYAITTFPAPAWGRSSDWYSGIVLNTSAMPDVPALCAALRRLGIEARPFWKPVHLQRPYAGAPRGPMSVCENLWPRILTLPCSVHLSASDQSKTIAALQGLLR